MASSYKEIWNRLFIEAYDDARERGFSDDEATELAEHLAQTGATSLLADRADRAKDRAKELGQRPPMKGSA